MDQKLCAAVSQDTYCVTGIKNAYDFAITRCGDDAVSRFDRYGFSKDFCCKCIVCDLIIWNDFSIYGAFNTSSEEVVFVLPEAVLVSEAADSSLSVSSTEAATVTGASATGSFFLSL